MNASLEKNMDLKDAVREFKDSVALFYQGSSLPYAVRAPREKEFSSEKPPYAETLFDGNIVRISRGGKNLYLEIKGACTHRAVVSSRSEADAERTAEKIIRFLTDDGASVMPTRNDMSNYLSVCNTVRAVADYCGCLTDFNPPEENAAIRPKSPVEAERCAFMLIALGAVCLIYRRLSALRGFNFKLLFEEGTACFAFSARIIAPDISEISDIPGYHALCDLDSIGRVTLYARLSDTGEPCDAPQYRLTVILTPQTEDPKGVLRAPEWRARMLERFEEIETEIEGRF